MPRTQPKPFVSGLKNPESVCLGPDGSAYVTEIGEFDKDGDGQVSVIKEGKASPFATGLDDPKGIVFFANAFYVTDKTRVVKIDLGGKVTPLGHAREIPIPSAIPERHRRRSRKRDPVRQRFGRPEGCGRGRFPH